MAPFEPHRDCASTRTDLDDCCRLGNVRQGSVYSYPASAVNLTRPQSEHCELFATQRSECAEVAQRTKVECFREGSCTSSALNDFEDRDSDGLHEECERVTCLRSMLFPRWLTRLLAQRWLLNEPQVTNAC